MSIRMIAIDLYRMVQEVERLEKAINKLPPTAAKKREKLEEELRKVRAERDYLRRMLDGQKDA